MHVHLPIDHERLPKTTRSGELRVGDVQYWNGHFFQIISTASNKTGRMLATELADACEKFGHTPPQPNWRPDCANIRPFTWNRQKRASTGHAVYRPVAVIREDPL